MLAIKHAFSSTNTDVRRACVGLLVDLHTLLEGTDTFARYTEVFLTLPQQKLLQIFIDKNKEKS